jgi:hypothetical protein
MTDVRHSLVPKTLIQFSPHCDGNNATVPNKEVCDGKRRLLNRDTPG